MKNQNNVRPIIESARHTNECHVFIDSFLVVIYLARTSTHGIVLVAHQQYYWIIQI